MENKESIQHSQLPNDLGKIKNITPVDLLVYTTIKFFTNKDTKECFPSISKIQEWTGLGKYAVNSSILKLLETKYMSRELKGRCYHYYFEDYDTFEPFGKEFLSSKELTPNEKALIIAESKYMYKHDKDKTGQNTFTNKILSEEIHMPESTISKCNRSLVKKGFLKLEPIENSEGKIVQKKIFDLEKLGQAVVFILKNHEERIQQTENKVSNVEKKLDFITEIINKNPKCKQAFEEAVMNYKNN